MGLAPPEECEREQWHREQGKHGRLRNGVRRACDGQHAVAEGRIVIDVRAGIGEVIRSRQKRVGGAPFDDVAVKNGVLVVPEKVAEMG